MNRNLFIHVQTTDLLVIQKELKTNIFISFREKIQPVISNSISELISVEFPDRVNDSETILKNVSRRLKNLIKNFNLHFRKLDLEKHYFECLRQECLMLMPTKENKIKNLGLSKLEFEKLCKQLKQGNESIIEQVYLKQFSYCTEKLQYSQGCTKDEAHEATLEALYEIRKDLLRDKITYGNLSSFFYQRSIWVLSKLRKKNRIHTTELHAKHENIIETSHDSITDLEYNQMVQIAIDQLGEECQDIIKQFYYEEIGLDEIAKSMDKSHTSVRKQISRCRNGLRNFLSKEFYHNYLSNQDKS